MWRLRVVHATGYAYKTPAMASFNEARVTPRSDSRQNVILNRVETIPPTRSYRYVDYWGTAVTTFDLQAPHESLEVTASSVVETAKGESPGDALSWDDLRSEPVLDRFDEYLVPTVYTPHNAQLRRVAQRLTKQYDPPDAVVAASRWVRNELAYLPFSTNVQSSGLDALKEGKGVCQDFAHLTLILLRSMGIPARYVSGYQHPQAAAVIGEVVDGQTHAWVQAWTGGWWDYDPTNDQRADERYVSVAVGRDYADVTPLHGVYTGGAGTDLDVVVEITRLA